MINFQMWISSARHHSHGYGRRMRWDKLFDDLESQLEQELTAEELDLEAEDERLRLGRLTLRDRLVALHASHPVGSDLVLRATLRSGLVLGLRPATFGRDWFSADLIDESSRGGQCIVPLAAIESVALSSDQLSRSLRPPSESGAALSARLSLPFVLRDLCRRRHPVDVLMPTATHHGTIDRVGRDHLDLAVHEREAIRRDAAVLEVRMIELSEVLLVRL
jgi:hypothetical protein